MDWLLTPFSFPFFVRGMAAAIIVGAICGALGPFIIVRRFAYIGQGLSQSVLGGVGVGLVFGAGLYPSAIAATALGAWLIDRLGKREGLYSDTAIGIVSTGMFALGVAVISANRSRSLNISNVLFGNILGVSTTDLMIVLAVALCAGTALAVGYKPLLFTTQDIQVARAHGIDVRRMEFLFNALVAAVIITALQVLGVLLITAVLLIPAATARTVLRSFGAIVVGSIAIGVMTSIIGLYASFYIDIASGPSIVLTGLGVFVLTLMATSLRQRLATRTNRRATPAT
ncbi:MAG: ABC-type Mn2+/Zn2+ transport system permease subunit [Myxococcota bacterium]|jgi:ABC-type Mn2+/Zn2+ transport system permease subunit